MTWEFLFFANLALLLRLRCVLMDVPPPAARWWGKLVLELAAMLMILELGPAVAGAAATSFVVTLAAIRADRRARDRNATHLLLGIAQLVALSICFGPWTTPLVRAGWETWVGELSQVSALGRAVAQSFSPNGLVFLFGLLLAAGEANLFLRWVLGRLQLRPGGGGAIDAGEYARGRVIGLLERTLIYFFVLNGHYGAVGFTLAAKAFTRFKELENRSFAEYVLIGTLLSSGLAMAIAAFVKSIV